MTRFRNFVSSTWVRGLDLLKEGYLRHREIVVKRVTVSSLE